MKRDSLSYETIQSMLLEKMQERSYSTVSVMLCRYVSKTNKKSSGRCHKEVI